MYARSLYQCYKNSQKKPEPFHVNEMCTEDFVNWKDACTQIGVNLTKDEEGNSVKIGLGGIKF